MKGQDDSFERSPDGSMHRKKPGLDITVRTRPDDSKKWWGVLIVLVLLTIAFLAYVNLRKYLSDDGEQKEAATLTE